MEVYKWATLTTNIILPERPFLMKFPFNMDFMDKRGNIFRYHKQTKQFLYIYSISFTNE